MIWLNQLFFDQEQTISMPKAPTPPTTPSLVDYTEQSYPCPQCQQGTLLPASNITEPEYNDSYYCSHCHYSTTLPSMLVIISQIISGLLGGILAGYLFISQLVIILKAYQLNHGFNLIHNYFQCALSIAFIGAFGFLLYKAIHGIQRRQRLLSKMGSSTH